MAFSPIVRWHKRRGIAYLDKAVKAAAALAAAFSTAAAPAVVASPNPACLISRFNESAVRFSLPSTPFTGHRGAFAGDDYRPAGSVAGLYRAEPPGRQEAVLAARPHHHQPVLREFDPHPHQFRAGR